MRAKIFKKIFIPVGPISPKYRLSTFLHKFTPHPSTFFYKCIKAELSAFLYSCNSREPT